MAPPRNTSVRYPGGYRALWGAAGFLTSYLLVLLVAVPDLDLMLSRASVSVRDEEFTLATVLGEATVPEWVGAGWILMNAHLVPLVVPVDLNGGRAGLNTNLITEMSGIYLFLLLLPPIILLVTGSLATRNLNINNPNRRAKQAAMQAFGYLPFSALAAFVFAVSIDAGTAAPDILWSIVLAGFIYPALFGALGGWFGAKFRNKRIKSPTSKLA